MTIAEWCIFGTLLLYLCAAALRRGLPARRAFGLGVALGCGLLVKATLTIFLPLSFIVGACVTLLALMRLLLSCMFVKSRAHEIFFLRLSKMRGLFQRCEV